MMNILMITNTYLPHVGGVANSVQRYKKALEKRGHKVMVIAPHFKGEKKEPNVLRVQALQNFNGSDFSLSMPTLILKNRKIEVFKPDIIHAHHPFLLGISALRIAVKKKIPIVFTHHTLYEHYTHYVPFDSKMLKSMAKDMGVVYSNLCDGVIAPSNSIRSLLIKRGVETKIETIPTGIKVKDIDKKSYKHYLEKFGIEKNSFVLGHVSRLAHEKNQHFLAKAVARFLQKHGDAVFVIVGQGEIKKELKAIFKNAGVLKQVIFTGSRKKDALTALYKRMDLFVFSSKSETQGMVIAEALLAKTPVVALDARAISEMIDSKNGYLVKDETLKAFNKAIQKIYALDKSELVQLKEKAYKSALGYSMDNCVQKLEEFYAKNIKLYRYEAKEREFQLLDKTLRSLTTEYEIWKQRAQTLFPNEVVDKGLSKLKELKNLNTLLKQ